jgi:hypothetical protein
MNIRKLFTGGEPDVRLDQILFGSNDDLRLALYASLASYAVGVNPNFIIDGCVVTVGGTSPSNTWSMTTGYIWLNDEILQVAAQSGTFDSGTQFLAFSKNTTYRSDGDKTFIDATPRQTLEQNRGIITVQGSVSATELDAINGDTIAEKLRLYIGEATTVIKGVVEKAVDSEMHNFTADKYPDAALLAGVVGGTPTAGIVTLSSLDNDIKTFYGLKRLQLSGNMAYSNIVIPAGSTLMTIPSTSWNPAPEQDIYCNLFIDIGGLGNNNWTALKCKYTTSRTLVTLEDTPAVVGGTNPFHINVVY